MKSHFLSEPEFWLSVSVLGFGLAGLIVLSVVGRSRDFSSDEIVRAFALIFIVTGALFLVTAAYTAEQVAPTIGLLGTLAGYLLGKRGKGE